MGTMIRLVNSVVDNNNLPVVPVPYTGIAGAKLVVQPRINLNLCRDISGNKTGISVIGAPIYHEAYINGGRDMLEVNYTPKVTESRTMCVVARVAKDVTGTAFFLGDFLDSKGCVLFAHSETGWRVQVNVDNGSGGVNGIFPTSLGLPEMSTKDWHFAALTVDMMNKTAVFYLPSFNFSKQANWDTALLQGGKIHIAGEKTISLARSSDVAYATYHDFVLSASEIKQQYAAAKSYCEAVGVDLK